MNEPKYPYPYPAQGHYQGPPVHTGHYGHYQGPPGMAPLQYDASAPAPAPAPPRRDPGFLEGCLAALRCCVLIDNCYNCCCEEPNPPSSG